MPALSPAAIVGIVAIAGFSLGGLTGLALAHFARRRQFQASQILRDLDRREDVYARLVEQASEMWLDALETPHDPANLIGLTALVGRVRMASSRPVLEAAEAMVDFLFDACDRKPADVRQLVAQAPREFVEPLRAFTAACRDEREQMLRAL
jgi:hypothetical protein